MNKWIKKERVKLVLEWIKNLHVRPKAISEVSIGESFNALNLDMVSSIGHQKYKKQTNKNDI
jgi:hypothetical protein